MILIADLHFGKESNSYNVDGVPIQRLDLLEKLYHIGGICMFTGQSLVIAGDIFNKLNPSSQIIEQWFKFLSSFPMIQIYIIPGNHDSGTEFVNMGMVKETKMVHVNVFTEPEIVDIEDSSGTARVLFYPHIPLSSRKETPSLDCLWESNVSFAVTHGQVQESEYQNDIFFEAGDALVLNLSTIPGLVFSGHIHNQSVYSRGKAKVVYPGSLTFNNFGEVEETKGYLSVPLNNPPEFTLNRFDESMGTRWQDIELDLTKKDEATIDEATVKEIADKAIIKLTVLVSSYGVVNESRIRAMFNKYGYVARYETRVVGKTVKEVVPPNNLSHTKLLAEWLSGIDVYDTDRKNAQSMGEKIITEVLA